MIQVINRALEILEYVARNPEKSSSLTEIANALNLNQATCANIIRTLADKNYLEHLGRKKGYRLGAMAYQLTGNLSYNNNLVLAAKDIMESLSDQHNESLILGILRNHKRFILHSVNSDQDLQVRSKTERNVYETASGRILLAFLSDNELNAQIQATGLPREGVWEGVASKNDLLKALENIRKAELAFTFSSKHIVGIAAPIRENGKVIAGLSFYLPESRFSPRLKKELIRSLKEAVQKINARL